MDIKAQVIINYSFQLQQAIFHSIFPQNLPIQPASQLVSQTSGQTGGSFVRETMEISFVLFSSSEDKYSQSRCGDGIIKNSKLRKSGTI